MRSRDPRVSQVRVTLTPADLYSVTFFHQLAKPIVDIATGQVEDRLPTPEEQGKMLAEPSGPISRVRAYLAQNALDRASRGCAGDAVGNPVQRGHRFQRKEDSNPVIADSG